MDASVQGEPAKGDVTAAVSAAMLVALAMIAQHVAAIATRDALFLTHYPARYLPIVMAASAVLSFGIVVGMSRLMTRHSPARAVPYVFASSAVLFAGEWLLSFEQPRVAAVAAYLHTAALGAAVISGFWSVVNERFDPHTAKRFIGRIGTGASLGGILGGLGAWQAGSLLPVPAMLAILALINVLCAAGLRRVTAGGSQHPHVAAPSVAPVSGLRVLRQVPYLRHIAALVAIVTLSEVTVDFVFKSRAADELVGGKQLITFFALFYSATGILGFALQSTLARRSLERVGLTGTIATYPATVALGGATALLFPGLWAVTALRGADSTLKSSLFRSGYELLYTPLANDRKRPTKTLIDVGASRLGGLGGSGLALVVLALAPAYANTALLGVALACAGVALLVVKLLHRGYVAALADGLKAGAIELGPDDVVDRVTRQTFVETTNAMERSQLIVEMDKVRARLGARGPGSPPAPIREVGVSSDVAELLSGDGERIRAALSGRPDPRLVPFLIPLLARDDVHRDVLKVLRVVATRATGQLIDAMVDPTMSFTVRRRIPRALATCPTQRAVDGLLVGLGDEQFELRYRCGLALARILDKTPEVTIDEALVLTAARRETELSESVWRSQSVADDDDDEHLFDADRANRSLEHVFTLLSLVLDTEPLQLAYQALAARDDNLRGVGLEYLDNVLPADIRETLWPYLGAQRVRRTNPRQPQVIVDELRSTLSIDPSAIREKG